MGRLAFLLALVAPAVAEAQAKAGWGNVGKQEPKGFSWTQPAHHTRPKAKPLAI